MSEKLSSTKQRIAAAALGAITAGSLFSFWRLTDQGKSPTSTLNTSTLDLNPKVEKDGTRGAKFIEAMLRRGASINYLNGSLAEDKPDGSTWVYSNPLIVYTGNPHVKNKLDPANFHFYTATQNNGVPRLEEIHVNSNMHVAGPSSNQEPLTMSAILAPVNNVTNQGSDFAHNYYVRYGLTANSHNVDIEDKSNGLPLFVGTAEVMVSPGGK